MQPLDNSVFPTLSTQYSTACRTWIREHPTHTFNKTNVASMIGSIWTDVTLQSTVQNGFKNTGIYPLNPDQIHPSRYTPSTLFQYTIDNNNSNIILQSPLITVNVNVTHTAPKPKSSKPKKVKIDTSHATFLTQQAVVDQLQQEQDEKKKQEAEVHTHTSIHLHSLTYTCIALIHMSFPVCVSVSLCVCVHRSSSV